MSNNIVRFVTRTIMVPVVLLVACNCNGGGGSSFDGIQFERWFVGTASKVPEWLEKTSAYQIDSLVRKMRATSGTGERKVILSDTAGCPFTLGFRTPDAVRTDTLYPLIVYLHGGTGSTLTTKGERAFDMYSFLADSIPLFIASPSANRDALWWSPAGLSRILQSIRYMVLHYPVDPAKIFCAGVSDGATGCYGAANTIAAPFAGFIAVSGFGGMLRQFGMELFPQNLMQHPLYNINAGNDRLYPVDVVNRFLDNMEKAGVGIRRKIYENGEHGFDYRREETGTLLELLGQWRRPERMGINWHFDASFPWAVANVLEINPENGRKNFSLAVGGINDTIKVRSVGVSSVVMYFAEDDARCGGCLKMQSERKCGRPLRAPWRYDYRVMKARCIPELKRYTYYSFDM